MVTLPWSCVLLILSETLLSVHSVLQGPQAAWCGGTHSPVSKHSSRALAQDSPFHVLPSFAWCTQDRSSCKTSTVLGFSPTLTPCAAWRTEKYVTLQDNQPACQQGKESTSLIALPPTGQLGAWCLNQSASVHITCLSEISWVLPAQES